MSSTRVVVRCDAHAILSATGLLDSDSLRSSISVGIEVMALISADSEALVPTNCQFES